MSRTLRWLTAVAFSSVLAFGAAHAQPQKQSAAEREAKARAYFTDTVLTTQSERKVKFYSDALTGKVVVLSFAFTECGDACPLIMAHLGLVRKELGESFGRDVRFITISVDPHHDRPEELRKFAKKFDAVHPQWWFLTGAPADIELVVKKLGAWTSERETHSTALIIGSTTQARWKKVRPDAPPRIVAEELRALIEGDVEARKSAQLAR